ARRTDRLDETASEVHAVGGTAYAHPLDVSDADSIAAFFSAAEEALGPVDVLVNNAAIATPGLLQEITVDAIARQVATNLLGPILLSRLAITSMCARQAAGDLVFISSDVHRHPRPM